MLLRSFWHHFHANLITTSTAGVCYYPQDMGAMSSFTFGDKEAVTMTTAMTEANFSEKLYSYEAQMVAAFLPKCT
jgi:hypothetical protein